MSRWLGLDIGTSSVKALVLDPREGVVERARVAYEPSGDGALAVGEQSALAYERAVKEAIKACGPHVDEVEAVGIVGQTPTCVFVDADGRPLRPALTWQDPRATSEARELAERFGPSIEMFGTELPWSRSFPPARLQWLLRNEPSIAENCRWVLQPKDFMALQLTGIATSDRWSSKGLCDVSTGAPAQAVLEAIGWPAHTCPDILDPWALAGVVTPRAAAAFGLPAGIGVAAGWSDALAGVLAVGGFDAESGFVLSGTSDIVGISVAEEGAAAQGLLSVPATCAPLPLRYGPTQASGDSIAWVASLLGIEEHEVPMLAERSSAPTPPLFVPYLSGERAPLWNEAVRGSFVGLDRAHGPADLTRAVMLGVALSAAHVLHLASSGRADVGTLAVGGRHAFTRAWQTARLETLGVPMTILAERETSTLGAALLGALATGRSFAELSSLRGEATLVVPTDEQRRGSAALLERYELASAHCVALADVSA